MSTLEDVKGEDKKGPKYHKIRWEKEPKGEFQEVEKADRDKIAPTIIESQLNRHQSTKLSNLPHSNPAI